MSQTQKVQGRSTTVYTDADGMTKTVYHGTAVVAFNAERIVLDTGGYWTVTTKLRMNQTANQFRLGFQVYQKAHAWWVTFQGKTIRFNVRKLTLDRTRGICKCEVVGKDANGNALPACQVVNAGYYGQRCEG